MCMFNGGKMRGPPVGGAGGGGGGGGGTKVGGALTKIGT